MKGVGRLLSVITWLLMFSSLVIITGGLFGRPLLMAAVPTGSMVPTLMPGDLIVVMPTWVIPKLGPGDIVVFRQESESRWVVHRILDGDSWDGYVTKGDANAGPDPDLVFPKDIAGIVPQVNGSAMRVRRLGLMSVESGPLSSPVVAGVALVMGVALLVLDAKRTPWRRKARPTTTNRRDLLLTMYLALAGTAFITTAMPAWMLSQRQFSQYEIVASRLSNVSLRGQYVAGYPHRERVQMHNPSALPIVVVYAGKDPYIHYDRTWALIPPKGTYEFTITVDNPNLGTHQAQLVMGVFLPVLPPQVLAWLANVSFSLTILVVALVPSGLVILTAFFDPRFRQSLLHWRHRVAARL